MPNPISPDDLAHWEAQWARAIAEEDRQHRHSLMFELARTAFPRLLTAYRELLEERRGVEYHDA